MSKYFSQKHGGLVAYVPGEQPKDRGYVKLNTNESPFPPSPRVAEAVQSGAQTLNLYCDPENTRINAAIAKHYGFEKSWVITGNGSDEILNYAVCAFCDANTPLVFADVTYGFYPVFAARNGILHRRERHLAAAAFPRAGSGAATGIANRHHRPSAAASHFAPSHFRR